MAIRRILLISLFTTAAPAAALQTAPVSNGSPEASDIVIIGRRDIIGSLRDTPVERSYDADHAASYGVSTVGEVIDEVAGENGDERPTLLVNGQPVADADDISSYPVEAIAKIEVLPRGSASRIGGLAGQRVYNVVLRKRVSSATVTLGRRTATEGGWSEDRSEVLLTRIEGQNRINLALRARGSGLLLESDRDLLQPDQPYPFDATGNILALPLGSSEIDPGLSAAAGQVVTVAGVPTHGRTLTLGDFAATGNRPNATALGAYRSLRSRARGYDGDLAGSYRLLPWLTASLTAKLGWTRDAGLQGLPSAIFNIPSGSPFSPFTRDVGLALHDPDRPLESRSRADTGSGSLMFAANLGDWIARLTARLSQQDRNFAFSRNGQSVGLPILLDPLTDPFAASTAGLIPLVSEQTHSRVSNKGVQIDLDGALMSLPAGQLRIRFGAVANRGRVRARQFDAGTTSFSRSDVTLQGGLTLPIASRRKGVLPMLGELEGSLDLARIDLSNRGALWRDAAALNWQFRQWLRLTANLSHDRRPPDVETLAAPMVTYPNVRILDPVRGETVDVTSIVGGNPRLLAERIETQRVGVGIAPLPKINLQLQAEYSATKSRNQIGGLPATSASIVAAFPERFVRDESGRLIVIDTRAVNFTRHDSSQLRYGINATIPLYRAAPAATLAANARAAAPRAAPPRPRIDLALAHTVVLSDVIVIRPTLPAIDLLQEGAIGIGGSRSRHLFDGSVALTDRGSGVRISGASRSANRLLTGTAAAPSAVRFGALTTVDLRAFVETARLAPGARWAKAGRITLAVQNIANTRQRVVDRQGFTPLNYQQAYRDAIGRSILIEFRMVI